MTDLFWPGDNRAGDLMSDSAFLAAMVEVENSWLGALVDAGVAPVESRADLTSLVSIGDVEAIAAGAEADGNPVIGLLALLRERADGQAAQWLHRGLTSQDVIDTAMMLCLRDALARIRAEIDTQVRTLAALAETHQHDPMLARTLTQPALPSTVGLKMATWLSGVLDAVDAVAALPPLPVQAGGAAGTMAAATELAGSPGEALALSDALANALELALATPWHTTRSAITRTGDALVTCCDAWGHVATDVATASRPEVGELAEGRGGGSSTMPHKSNPVLSVLIRRASLVAPALGATLLACLAFTWLNPHVYLDTLVLLGSVSTRYAGQRANFALGAMTASCLFFFSLGYGARLLRPLFANPKAWRVLDAVIGITMALLAVKLVLES